MVEDGRGQGVGRAKSGEFGKSLDQAAVYQHRERLRAETESVRHQNTATTGC